MKGSVLLALLIVIELSCGSLHTLYDQLCLGIHNGFLRHPVDCHKFIRCSHQKAYEFHCPANLLWHQKIKSCDYSYRTECKVNAIAVKGQKVNVTGMLVEQHNKLINSDKNFKEIAVKVDSVTVKELVTATTQKPTNNKQKPFTTVKDHVNTTDHKEHSVKLTQADNKNIAAKEYFVKNATTSYSLQSANPEQGNLVVTTGNATKTLNSLKVLPNKAVAKEIENVNELAVIHKENKSRIKRNNCNRVSKLKEKATANKNNKSNVKKITVNNVNLTENSTVKPNINSNDSVQSFDTNSVNGLNLTGETVHYNNVNITEAILTEFPKPDSGITKNLNNSLNLKENNQYETEAVKISSSENNNRIMSTDKTVAVKADKVTDTKLTEFPKTDTGITKNLNNSLNLKEIKQNETVALTKSSPENQNTKMLTEKTVSANTVSVIEPILTDFQNVSYEITRNLNNSLNLMKKKYNDTLENNNKIMLIENIVAVNAANVTESTFKDFPKAAIEITNNFENSLNLKKSTLQNQNKTEASSTDNNNRTLVTEESIYVNLTEAILTDFPNVHNFLNFKENKTVAVTASSAENNNRTMITTETVSVNNNTVTEAILTDFSKPANKVTKNLDNSSNLNENISAELIYKDNEAVAQKQSSNANNSTHNSSMLEQQADSAKLIKSTESLLTVLQEVTAIPLQPTEIIADTVTDIENMQTTAAIFNSLNTTEGFTGNHNSAMLKQKNSSANFIKLSETITESSGNVFNTTVNVTAKSTNIENENVTVAKNTISPKNSSATVTEKKTNNVNSIILTDSLLKGFPEAFKKITTPAKNENVTKIMENYLNTKNSTENISEIALGKDNNSINDIELTQSLLKAFTETAKTTTESSVNFLSLTDNVTVNTTDLEKAITHDPVKSFTLTESSTETNNRDIAASTVNAVNLTDNNTVKVTDKENESETLTAQYPVNLFNSTESATETSNKNNLANFTLQEVDKNHAVNLTEAMLAGVPEGFKLIHKDPMKTKQNSDKNKDVHNISLTVTMPADLTEAAVNLKNSLNSTENVTVKETEDNNANLTVAAEYSIETVSKTTQAENVNLTVNSENPVYFFNLTESFNPTNNSDSFTDLNLTANFPVKKMEEENVNLTVNAENPVNNVNVIENFNQTNKTIDNVLTENPVNSVNLTENVVEYVTDFSVKLTYNENKTTTKITDYSINDKNDKGTVLTEVAVKTANDENKNITDFSDETRPVINGNTNTAENVTATMLTADDEILKEITTTNETFIQNAENSVNIGNVTEIMLTQEAVNNDHVKETMLTNDPVKNVIDEIHNFNDFYIDTTSILKENSATTERLMENAENYVKSETIFTENPPAITTTQILFIKNDQSDSTTPAVPTTLAVPFAIDNTTLDPRLPFRSLECQGPNNRRQFKAPKCYQYYQCFAGWAFLLNCHEGWRFEVTEGLCILDVNKECEL
ncbi:protein PF3D7_1417600-like [Calliphora vicina]|uniref:protein PF3D7_1417600-like n=1 Tax=Calliphora vicina TaxID=7373 RepID=UPI00325C1EE6